MALTPQWDNDRQQLVICEFGDHYTWEDFYKGVRDVHHLVASVGHRVDVILCYRANLPPGSPLIHFRKAFETQPSNIGKVIIVNTVEQRALISFMKALLSVLQKIVPNKSAILFADSLDSARQMLHQHNVRSTNPA